MESIDDAVEDYVPLTNECRAGAGVITQHRVVAAGGWTTPGEESITWLSWSMAKRSGADARTMPIANWGRSSVQPTQRSFQSTFPSPRIQHGAKEFPMTPTSRRPLQRRRQHLTHPSLCHTLGSHQPSQHQAGFASQSDSTEVLGGEEADAACFIVEPIDTQLEGDGRGVQASQILMRSVCSPCTNLSRNHSPRSSGSSRRASQEWWVLLKKQIADVERDTRTRLRKYHP